MPDFQPTASVVYVPYKNIGRAEDGAPWQTMGPPRGFPTAEDARERIEADAQNRHKLKAPACRYLVAERVTTTEQHTDVFRVMV